MKMTEQVSVFLKDDVSEFQRSGSKFKLTLATRIVSWKFRVVPWQYTVW